MTTPNLAKNQGKLTPGGYVDGLATWESLLNGTAGGANPWTLVQTRAQVQSLAVGREHTNSLAPLFAKGSGSELFERYAVRSDPAWGKYIDNTDINKVMTAATASPK